jgi:hypothetical protein
MSLKFESRCHRWAQLQRPGEIRCITVTCTWSSARKVKLVHMHDHATEMYPPVYPSHRISSVILFQKFAL